MPALSVIQVRRGTAAAWTAANPTLAAGEFGLETDTGKVKIGDGSTVWASLAYLAPSAGGGTTPTGTGFTHVTSGAQDAAAKLVEAADVAASLKPSGTATGTDESLRRLGTGSTHAAAGDDSRFPSAGEKNALAGTSGTPGSLNKYVTDGDSRLGDSRAPSGTAGGVLDGSYPNPGLAAAVAGNGLAETADVLSVNVDGSTLEISADALRVKALGITDSHVAAANKDGVAATASMRTLGTGAQQAAAGTDSRLSDARTPTAHADSHKPGGTDALMTVVRAAGTSASGTPTTAVAALTAAASTQFVGWSIVAAQQNAASTQLTVIVTYSDATTDSATSTVASASEVQANAGGIERIVSGAHNALLALQSKAVTGLRVETAGTGTGARAAAISAIQVPL